MCLSDRQVSFLSCICGFRRLQRHNFIYELMYIYVKYNAESLEVPNHAKVYVRESNHHSQFTGCKLQSETCRCSLAIHLVYSNVRSMRI